MIVYLFAGLIIKHLARHPEMLYELQPRQFELLVADLLRSQGFQTTFTPLSHDGGRDIEAVRSDALGEILYLVECKRYAPHNKVGVEIIRSIHGVVQSERANKGVIVTTSSFTKGAIAFASPLRYSISLKDYDALKIWLANYR